MALASVSLTVADSKPKKLLDQRRDVLRLKPARRKILKVVKQSPLRKARSVPSFDARRNLLSGDQTSLYTKIDIFFRVAITAGAQSATNVKWPAREVFLSLDATHDAQVSCSVRQVSRRKTLMKTAIQRESLDHDFVLRRCLSPILNCCRNIPKFVPPPAGARPEPSNDINAARPSIGAQVSFNQLRFAGGGKITMCIAFYFDDDDKMTTI